ncbi:MAG: translation initiation factor IF-2 [Bacteroidetes bacterium]|jgi:translation initiation factor IF-2|nr:translation initiation factor IF-2 [Bacteroidota bacterium]MBT6687877.1 translation initiation factor IF-2 [Bacteroidota bacterium]MBT7142475.1 translation initiation factor IF-2 [Bacteroidota bacterium]MBT7490018.1 translation initiation factor IF-2 [Bacteroidota bacterium]
MAEVKKAKRLSKLVKEFNVGMSTIVEFLEKKGLKIEAKPTSKVPPEFLDILNKEYSSDVQAKEQSKEFSKKTKIIRSQYSAKDKTEESLETEIIEENDDQKDIETETQQTKEISNDIIEEQEISQQETLEDLSEEKHTTEEINEIIGQEVEIKTIEVDKVVETPTEQAVEQEVVLEATESDKAESIDEEIKPETVEEKPEEVIEQIQPIEQELDEIIPEEPVEQKTQPAEEKISKPSVEISDDLPVVEESSFEEDSKVESTEETQETIASKPVPEKAEEIIESSPAVEETIVQEKTTEEKADITKGGKEKEIKVVGKIDLDSINQKTRPGRKSYAEKRAEKKAKEIEKLQAKSKRKPEKADGVKESTVQAEETKVAQKPSKEKPEASKTEDGVYKPEIRKLSGPTVVGKIDLDKITTKKVSSDNKEEPKKRKKKRKRIKKERVDVAQNIQVQKKEKQKTDNRKHDKQKKKIVRTEILEVDVQKQIKDTLAKLTSKGKSKGSKHRRLKREAVSQKSIDDAIKVEAEKNVLKVTEFVSVNEIATMMDIPVNNIISTCMNLGLFVSINQRLDAETITLVADEFGFKTEFISIDVQEAINETQPEEDEKNLKSRAPIATVMGHVDHGKTSLLDYVRNANVIAGEAGGITQHIGAYNVTLFNDKEITFLDTPGHEAFTAMRARGAQVTDIAIIVVASDDKVMPQTVEAINHATAAGVPIVFAINKIDRPGANPEKIKEELANLNFMVEDWGGKYQSQEISAKFGKNIEELLEKVLLEAEMLELKANADRKATGTVIESSLDRGRGYLATILVQNGTLRIGDTLLAGMYSGKVKAMYNERGVKVEIAGPSSPVMILGLDGAPQAGDGFNVMKNEREAREIANKRLQLFREQGLRTQKHITLDEIGRRLALGNFQEINIIVKGDVDGSIEALSDSLIKLSTEKFQVNITHKAVGQISESDVMLASASNAIIVGFQVRPSINARKLAEKEEIDIRLYSVIYDAINDMKDAMEGMLSTELKEDIIGSVEIREVFKISKVGTVAGCMVKEGRIERNAKVRLIREGIVIYTGDLASLKRFKEDVKDVASGYECGLNIANFNDIKVGDIVEAFKMKEVKQTL